ncbi:hypothetical protein LCGC14_2006170 [marine sediment metagenome]|uniref:Uncharacterized protein n=1 Tax=marine sediment metagenome TaxID=412755 RepID=A0A0F9FPD8_9ZZZZ
MTTRTDNTEDQIDSRDILERIKEIEDGYPDEAEREELATLNALIVALRELGGDTPEQGLFLIADSYFEVYAQELAEDIGAINSEAAWPVNCIDWEEAASELKQDYCSVEYDDVTYWVR